MGRQGRPDLLIGLLILVPALALLAGHVYLGSFSRYIADDFCTAAYLRRLGFWGSQLAWYREWSGRFGFTFLVNLTHLVGPRLTPWLPGMTIVAWYGALLLLLRQADRTRTRRRPGMMSLVLAALALALTLEGSPNIYQSLYWQTGILTYSLPLILGTLYLAWFCSSQGSADSPARVSSPALLGSALFAFLAGGFSETYATLQVAGLGFCLLVCWTLLRGIRRKRATCVLGVGLLGAVLSLAVVALAPGNSVRMSTMPPHPGMWDLSMHSVQDAYIFVYQVAKYQTVPLIMAVAVPALLTFVAPPHEDEPTRSADRSGLILLGIIPLLTAALLVVPFVPYEFAFSSYPDGRMLITQQYVLVLGIVVWSALVGFEARKALQHRWPASATIARILLVASAALTLLVAVQSIKRLGDEQAAFAEFAASWDARDASLRAEASQHPEATISAASLRHMGGLSEIGDDPAEWINVCIADAYDARAVIAK
jgi:hypothetical protein